VSTNTLARVAGAEVPLPGRAAHDAVTTITLSDRSSLSIHDVCRTGHGLGHVSLSRDAEFRARLERSAAVVRGALRQGETVYGVNTNFGGLADSMVQKDHASLLQENLIWGLKCGIGRELPRHYIRSAMLIRAGTLAKCASGVRAELIERLIACLNADICPVVRDLGSLGASGDLVPLAHIAGAVLGLSPSYRVNFRGENVDAHTALRAAGLAPLKLEPKEGLALVNGTSMLSGIAANVLHETQGLMRLALWVNAFLCQSMLAMLDPFDPFVHCMKPHPGQVKAAALMRSLLQPSPSVSSAGATLAQDRYSIRCIPQHYGPLLDGLDSLERQIATEINSADDNPLVDLEQERLVHGGNFHGQYVGIGMDQLRQYLCLAAKQIDAQISLLVTPEFNHCLPASLAFEEHGVRFGLKGLQICANSIVPRLLHLGNPVVCFFPTHAEQFNQNINSQGFNAAVLAAESLSLFRHYLAVSLLFGVQGVELRAQQVGRRCDGRVILSPVLAKLYQAVYELLGVQPSGSEPLVRSNRGISLDEMSRRLYDDLERPGGRILTLLRRHEAADEDQ